MGFGLLASSTSFGVGCWVVALYCVVWLFTVCFAVVCWVFMVCCVNSVVRPCFLICGFMFCLLVVSCVGVACSAVVIVFWFERVCLFGLLAATFVGLLGVICLWCVELACRLTFGCFILGLGALLVLIVWICCRWVVLFMMTCINSVGLFVSWLYMLFLVCCFVVCVYWCCLLLFACWFSVMLLGCFC